MISILWGCKCDANSSDFQPPKLKIVLASIISNNGPSTTSYYFKPVQYESYFGNSHTSYKVELVLIPFKVVPRTR